MADVGTGRLYDGIIKATHVIALGIVMVVSSYVLNCYVYSKQMRRARTLACMVLFSYLV